MVTEWESNPPVYTLKKGDQWWELLSGYELVLQLKTMLGKEGGVIA